MKRSLAIVILLALAAIGIIAGSGCDELVTEVNNITVSGCPHAEFAVLPDSGCEPLDVQFQDESDGPIVTWAWSFGDGETSTEQEPEHTYATGGSYTVSLTVTDSNGGADTEVKKRAVMVGAAVASFAADKDSGCIPLDVEFENAATGVVSEWDWDFGDSSTSKVPSPMHLYTDTGTYTVTMVVSGFCGDDTLVDTIRVTFCQPVASFTADSLVACDSLTVTFTAEAGDSTTPIDTWEWDFGDGTNGVMGQQQSHTYIGAASYGITLVVTGPGGTDTFNSTDSIVINPSPFPDWAVDSIVGTTAFFSNNSANASIYKWTFGDLPGTTFVESPVLHNYPGPGDYTVNLRVENAECGFVDSTLTVTIP